MNGPEEMRRRLKKEMEEVVTEEIGDNTVVIHGPDKEFTSDLARVLKEAFEEHEERQKKDGESRGNAKAFEEGNGEAH